jgi:hypothetical protein
MRIFKALKRAVEESRERSTVYYPIASDGYVGECYLCGWDVYEGTEWVTSDRQGIRVCHIKCHDLPIILFDL